MTTMPPSLDDGKELRDLEQMLNEVLGRQPIDGWHAVATVPHTPASLVICQLLAGADIGVRATRPSPTDTSGEITINFCAWMGRRYAADKTRRDYFLGLVRDAAAGALSVCELDEHEAASVKSAVAWMSLKLSGFA